MLPDDPRHGTPAGYQAHERAKQPTCGPCRDAYTRFRKRVAYAKRNGERMVFSSEEVRSVMRPWLDMGLTPSAVAWAAGLGPKGGGLSAVLTDGLNVRRSTYHALSKVTEDDFSPYAKVHADLTRHRIYSLMAAGHTLQEMPASTRGQWRRSPLVSVALARDIRAHFRALEGRVGPSRKTMSRARNAGHRPPLAWDDPGTLAWPDGVAPKMPRPRRAYRPHDEIDPVIVDRLLDGEPIREATNAERKEAMRRWLAMGNSERSLCRALGWKDGRYLPRDEDAA